MEYYNTFRCQECGRCCTGLRKQSSNEARISLDRSQGRGGMFYVPSTAEITPSLFEWEVQQLIHEGERLGVKFNVRPQHVFVDRRLRRPLVMEWSMHFDDCPFLLDGRCSVYGRHPLVCRQFPFLSLNALSSACPNAIPVPKGMDRDGLGTWMVETYDDVYRNTVHFNLVMRHNYLLLGLLCREGTLTLEDDINLKKVNGMVNRAGTVGLFKHLVKIDVIPEEKYSELLSKLSTVEGAMHLVRSMGEM